ncbi:SRPBCC family protein [Saccharothrix variisporea]|uniref:Polyketide cyclase/dehydrase/lipid transport protein n=1 Tax=Saccharothrix variisporea TaxID=543527 RepID=A0A495XAS5_9PSEU|nr:SRPBCC family protein [Saccharothrix variisporea]RKT68628.1 polyketide cyclase/dehydrase/lipid transport protein [Saccharothrix variisporea]
MSDPDARASVDVAAPAEHVYELVSDLAGMAELAEEYSGGRWLDGASGPGVGARFRGTNRRGIRLWTTVATVTDARTERFAFVVHSLGMPVSRWQYDIEPSDTGCRVTESTWDLRPSWFKPLTVLATGVRDRGTRNQANIESTLARLKQAAERSRRPYP